MKFLASLLVIVSALPSAVFGVNTLQQVTNYGLNPGNVEMHYYIPDCIKGNTAGRPLLVALHYCTGTAQLMYGGAHDGPSFKSLADKYGFVVLYPEVTNDPGKCWDVSHAPSLTRWGGSESESIVNQVTYAINTWTLNSNKVFAIGLSAGASMVNALMAMYPDKFAGGAVYAGVAYQCFVSTSLWSYECSSGNRIKTAQQWGDLVRAAYPTYTGQYPKLQLWHNDPDEFFHYNNLEEQIKQWTNVHGYTMTPSSTVTDSPTGNWDRRIYGPKLQALNATEVGGHTFRIESEDTINFFGLNSAVPSACATPVSTTTTTTTPPTSTNTAIVPKWQQCGGVEWTGPTTCIEGTTCQYIDLYYWQCKAPY